VKRSVDSLLAIIGKKERIFRHYFRKTSRGNPADTANLPQEAVAVPETTKESSSVATSSLPKGVVVITMPRLRYDDRRNRCNLVEKVGDAVAEGDILAEIETDKATMEFESFNAGTLLYVGIEEGNTVSVDSL
jgi:pyruvate dehydrogenase E2 component (dihydrolipoamide acetyltransferase)